MKSPLATSRIPINPQYKRLGASVQKKQRLPFRTRRISRRVSLILALTALAYGVLISAYPGSSASVGRRPAPSFAPVQGSYDCAHGMGGAVYATGKQVEVEILQGNPDAAFTSDLFLSINGRRPINFGTNHSVGRVVRLGRIPDETEMVFFISVRETGDVFFTGPGSRNSDGIAHAIVDCLGGWQGKHKL